MTERTSYDKLMMRIFDPRHSNQVGSAYEKLNWVRALPYPYAPQRPRYIQQGPYDRSSRACLDNICEGANCDIDVSMCAGAIPPMEYYTLSNNLSEYRQSMVHNNGHYIPHQRNNEGRVLGGYCTTQPWSYERSPYDIKIMQTSFNH